MKRPNDFLLKNDTALEIFGKLVRQLAVDKNAQRCYPRDEFIGLLAKNGLEVKKDFTLDGNVQQVTFYDRTPSTYSILLPLAERVDWGSGDNDNPPPQLDYSIPAFYADLQLEASEGRAVVVGQLSEEAADPAINTVREAEKLDNLRIGDYCSAQCM